jgi:hypothetical protein
MSSNTYLMVVHREMYNRLSRSRVLLWLYISFGWGVPLIVSSIAFMSGKMGVSVDETCWLVGDWYISLCCVFFFGLVWAVVSLIAADRAVRKWLPGNVTSRTKSLVEMMALSVMFYMLWMYITLWMLFVHLTGNTTLSRRGLVSYALVLSGTGVVDATVWSLLSFRGRLKPYWGHGKRALLLTDAVGHDDHPVSWSTPIQTETMSLSSTQQCIPVTTESESSVTSVALPPTSL